MDETRPGQLGGAASPDAPPAPRPLLAPASGRSERPRPGPGSRPRPGPAPAQTPSGDPRTSDPGRRPAPPTWTPPPWVPGPSEERQHLTPSDGFTPQAERVASTRPPAAPGGRRGFRRLIRPVVVALVVVAAAVAVRTFVAAPFYIPSASMEPTLHGCDTCNDDHVLVDKLAYDLHGVHRGDVVVFDRPDTWPVSEQHLIKRVVGLPGDVLTVRGGNLYVNGLELVEPYLKPSCGPLLSLGEGPTPPTKRVGPIPEGEVFVMGDNRCDSADSRAFGPVPESDIVGRAFVIIWPLSRLHYL